MEEIVGLVIDVATELARTEAPSRAGCCIDRVPPPIHKVNEEAYTPQVISIGPFHFGNQRLQFMENQKYSYLERFLQRAGQQSLEYWVNYIKNLTPNVRSYYADIIELSDDELVKVILVDAGFILELFLRSFYNDWTDEEKISIKPWLSTTMKVDLLLLENQLPFVVLQQIFSEAFPPARQHDNGFPSLLELTFDYFAYYNTRKLGCDNVRVKHFTDMLRIFHLPDRLPRRADNNDQIHLHTTTELVEAGLELKVDNSINCLSDMRFSKGIFKRVLRIPRFPVDGATEILYRNLLALEQCDYPHEAYVTDYIRIFEFLINTGKDVDLLVKNGIMTIGLGDSNAVADIFNSLLKNITPVNFNVDHLELYEDLKDFHDNPVNGWRASFNRDYCSTPCHSLASFAVLVLLAFSAAQILLSVLNLRKKK